LDWIGFGRVQIMQNVYIIDWIDDDAADDDKFFFPPKNSH